VVAPIEAPNPTIWVDTNVMIEIFTFGDFFFDLLQGDATRRIAEREGRIVPDPMTNARQRRLRIKHSLWMAMALCRRRAVTISYDHEVYRSIWKVAPPNTRLALPTKALFNALMPNGLFNGWTMTLSNAGVSLGNRARDRLMVDLCRDDALLFISRDDDALGYAASQGVLGVYPEHYAVDTMPLLEARAMFLSRLDQAALRAAFDHVGFSSHPGWLTYYLHDAIERYEGVWEWGWRGPETR